MGRPHLRVLYVSLGYTTHDRRFLSSFSGAGWDIVNLRLLDDRLEGRPLPEGVGLIPWPGRRGDPSDVAHWSQQGDVMKAVLGEVNPDVVIAGPVQSGAYAAALAGAQRLVTVSWGTDILVDADRNESSREATRFTLDRSAAVFGDCDAVRKAVLSHSSISRERIVTFPWGIDLDKFSPGAPSSGLLGSLGWEGLEIFISTRTWEPVYAIDVLVRAFGIVSRARPNARLMLLGNGSQESSIQALIDELALRDLTFTPGRIPHDELPGYFRSASAYVSSALSDGTSISLLEAMASALPVVVSGTYGNLEWVQHGLNGALASPGDPESLAAGMLDVIASPDVSSAMGQANVEIARRRANWQQNFPELVTMIERVAAEV